MFRTTRCDCKVCGKAKLHAIESLEGRVLSYRCDNCGARYHAEAVEGRQGLWWEGKLLNQETMAQDNDGWLKGLFEWRREEEPAFIGTFAIEPMSVR
ncbi:MAG: hypothetical protein HYT79_00320 [Elusimicrobia bacterium]|nr:hypothetical protein [Elusimicrobiota bacterium]